VVEADITQVRIRQSLQDLKAFGSLHRQERGLIADVRQLHILPEMIAHPGEIFVDIGRVDHQHILFRVETVNDEIVHDTAAGVAHGGVLCLAVRQLPYIVNGDILQKIFRAAAFQQEFSHMGNIKDTGGGTHRPVFPAYAGIGNGHPVSRKIHHFCVRCDMPFIKRGFFRHKRLLYHWSRFLKSS